MLGSAIVYSGLILTLAGLALLVKPIARLRVRTRPRPALIAVGGMLLVEALYTWAD